MQWLARAPTSSELEVLIERVQNCLKYVFNNYNRMGNIKKTENWIQELHPSQLPVESK
jgi:hypothetical protein